MQATTTAATDIAHEPRSANVTPERGKFAVAASPLNGVKFELGVILVVGLLLLLIQGQFSDSLWVQFGLLLLYGLGSAAWIVLRVRQVLARQGTRSHHGP